MICRKVLTLFLMFFVLVHQCRADDLESCLRSAYELYVSETHQADVDYSADLVQAQADKDYAIENAARVTEVALASAIAVGVAQTAWCVATYAGLPPPLNTVGMSVCFGEVQALLVLELQAIVAAFTAAMAAIEAIYLYQMLVAQDTWYEACTNVSEAYEARRSFCNTLYP